MRRWQASDFLYGSRGIARLQPVPVREKPTCRLCQQDILIRNSFHMLTESEKQTRRSEYKSKQVAQKSAGAGGVVFCGSAASMPVGGNSDVANHFNAATSSTAAAAAGNAHGGSSLPPEQVRGGNPPVSPSQSHQVPPLELRELKGHPIDSIERVVKLEGISPGASKAQREGNHAHPRPRCDVRNDGRCNGVAARRPPALCAVLQDGGTHGRHDCVDPWKSLQCADTS